MEEVWKDIAGYEGLYQVSNLGNVRSLNWRNTKLTKNLWLKPHNKGYLQVELAKNGTKKSFVVHRLVASAFLENPFGYEEVNHKDEDKRNNNVENLEWCNRSYNVLYSIKNRKNVANRKYFVRKGKNADLKVQQISKDGTVVKTWNNSREIFLVTGMSDWSISECCRGKRKTAYGYFWRYAS